MICHYKWHIMQHWLVESNKKKWLQSLSTLNQIDPRRHTTKELLSHSRWIQALLPPHLSIYWKRSDETFCHIGVQRLLRTPCRGARVEQSDHRRESMSTPELTTLQVTLATCERGGAGASSTGGHATTGPLQRGSAFFNRPEEGSTCNSRR